MSWFTSLFSSSKTVDNVLDKDNGLLSQVGSWIGGQQYTEEEKAEFNERMRVNVTDYAKATMDESTERSKARREIARMWIKAQLGLILLCAIAIPLDPVIAESYFNLATNNVMLAGTGAIITFFFGSYMLARHNATKKI